MLALDEYGKSSFNALQNNSSSSLLQYVVLDRLILNGQDVVKEPLSKRRELLEKHVLPKLAADSVLAAVGCDLVMNRLVSLRPAGKALSRRPQSSLVHIDILADAICAKASSGRTFGTVRSDLEQR